MIAEREALRDKLRTAHRVLTGRDDGYGLRAWLVRRSAGRGSRMTVYRWWDGHAPTPDWMPEVVEQACDEAAGQLLADVDHMGVAR